MSMPPPMSTSSSSSFSSTAGAAAAPAPPAAPADAPPLSPPPPPPMLTLASLACPAAITSDTSCCGVCVCVVHGVRPVSVRCVLQRSAQLRCDALNEYTTLLSYDCTLLVQLTPCV